MVTSNRQEIKIWELGDYEYYEEKASIEIAENEKNVVIALSEDGNSLAISGTAEILCLW